MKDVWKYILIGFVVVAVEGVFLTFLPSSLMALLRQKHLSWVQRSSLLLKSLSAQE